MGCAACNAARAPAMLNRKQGSSCTITAPLRWTARFCAELRAVPCARASNCLAPQNAITIVAMLRQPRSLRSKELERAWGAGASHGQRWVALHFVAAMPALGHSGACQPAIELHASASPASAMNSMLNGTPKREPNSNSRSPVQHGRAPQYCI